METRPHLALPPGPRLSPPETRALIARAREGDREARERLIEANLRLVMSVARRFLGRGSAPGRIPGHRPRPISGVPQNPLFDHACDAL